MGYLKKFPRNVNYKKLENQLLKILNLKGSDTTEYLVKRNIYLIKKNNNTLLDVIFRSNTRINLHNNEPIFSKIE